MPVPGPRVPMSALEDLEPAPFTTCEASIGKDYGRSLEEMQLDLAWAIAEYERSGTPIMDTLRAMARGRLEKE